MPVFRAFIFGLLSYVPYHYAIGVLAQVPIPLFAKELMRTYKQPAVIVFDLAVTALPLVILFGLLSFLLFRWVVKPRILTAVMFSTGWAVVALGLILYGHYALGDDMLSPFGKWPHMLVNQFAPVGGSFLGARLAFCARHTNARGGAV